MAADKVSLIIDRKKCKGVPGQTILEVARDYGIEIPTLCYHEALTPTGSCRVCVVEVTHGNRTRTMASCVTPIADGMKVVTDSKQIRSVRRMVVALLEARCPDLEVIKDAAKEVGLKKNPFPREHEDCFLCGMCVRACQEIVGVGAIGFAHRGPESEVVSPFSVESSICIGCGTCATICPARTLTLEKVFKRRSMHTTGGKRDIFRCTVCENHYTGT
jgi:NADH dehydrogenase/NADH:ubiquinone oxidoreductase subunit G